MILPSVSTMVEHFYLLKMSATVLETRTTYFKKEIHFFIDQPLTCRFFMLCCIQSLFLNQSGNQFSLYRQKQPPEVFYKKGVLRNFAKFTGKYLCQSLFFNKVAGLRSLTLIKNKLWCRCFPVNFAKLLRTPFLQNASGRLLLYRVCLKKFTFAKLRQILSKIVDLILK